TRYGPERKMPFAAYGIGFLRKRLSFEKTGKCTEMQFQDICGDSGPCGKAGSSFCRRMVEENGILPAECKGGTAFYAGEPFKNGFCLTIR
ncbi:hypothetical protein, partial [Akkermansia sp.]|uniref:hypothetical protein n=1 Tax=Akkermansia sp. TaxID=1872421 RepID=UPI003A862A3A